MSNIIPRHPDEATLAKMSVAELRAGLSKSLGITVGGLIEAAVFVKELERRGEDLSDIRDSTLPNLRKIACGQLLPEMYLRLFGKSGILNRVATLPIPDQQKIASGVPIAVYLADGSGNHVLHRAEDMEPAMAQQVFAPGKIRNQSEQIAWLRAREIPRPRAAGPAITIDRRRKGIHAEAHSFISLADLRDFVDQLTD